MSLERMNLQLFGENGEGSDGEGAGNTAQQNSNQQNSNQNNQNSDGGAGENILEVATGGGGVDLSAETSATALTNIVVKPSSSIQLFIIS